MIAPPSAARTATRRSRPCCRTCRSTAGAVVPWRVGWRTQRAGGRGRPAVPRRRGGDGRDVLRPGGSADGRRRRDAWSGGPGRRAGGLTKAARVRAVIALRLAQNRPHREAVRRAVSVLAMPMHARQAAGCTARTVDAIWHAAGDRASDFSWYTKRGLSGRRLWRDAAVLAARHAIAEGNDAATLAFLDRRLAGLGRIGRLRGRADVAALAPASAPPHRRPAIARSRLIAMPDPDS